MKLVAARSGEDRQRAEEGYLLAWPGWTSAGMSPFFNHWYGGTSVPDAMGELHHASLSDLDKEVGMGIFVWVGHPRCSHYRC